MVAQWPARRCWRWRVHAACMWSTAASASSVSAIVALGLCLVTLDSALTAGQTASTCAANLLAERSLRHMTCSVRLGHSGEALIVSPGIDASLEKKKRARGGSERGKESEKKRARRRERGREASEQRTRERRMRAKDASERERGGVRSSLWGSLWGLHRLWIHPDTHLMRPLLFITLTLTGTLCKTRDTTYMAGRSARRGGFGNTPHARLRMWTFRTTEPPDLLAQQFPECEKCLSYTYRAPLQCF
jgi:hypothetical protein